MSPRARLSPWAMWPPMHRRHRPHRPLLRRSRSQKVQPRPQNQRPRRLRDPRHPVASSVRAAASTLHVGSKKSRASPPSGRFRLPPRPRRPPRSAPQLPRPRPPRQLPTDPSARPLLRHRRPLPPRARRRPRASPSRHRPARPPRGPASRSRHRPVRVAVGRPVRAAPRVAPVQVARRPGGRVLRWVVPASPCRVPALHPVAPGAALEAVPAGVVAASSSVRLGVARAVVAGAVRSSSRSRCRCTRRPTRPCPTASS